MAKSKYLDYRDSFITIFCDDEKYFVVFVNDRGSVNAINYDDNFYYVEYLIDTYFDLIVDSFKRWGHKDLTDEDWREIAQHTIKYIKHLKRSQAEINYELICEETRGVIEKYGS